MDLYYFIIIIVISIFNSEKEADFMSFEYEES